MIGSLLLKLLPSFLFHDYLTRQKLVDVFFLRFSRDLALSLRRMCYICYLFLLKVNLRSWKALGLGENGTFNSEDTVQLPMLINYFKPLSLVAEQCLLTLREYLSVSTESHRGPSVACGLAIDTSSSVKVLSLHLIQLEWRFTHS